MPKHLLIIPVVGYDRVLDGRSASRKLMQAAPPKAVREHHFRFADHKGRTYVESESTPDKWYELDNQTCSCPAYQGLVKKGKPHFRCKHLWAWYQRAPRLGPTMPWAAELTGRHPLFDWRREFLRGDLDFREMNKSGSRGVRMIFVVREGACYEVFEHINYSKSRRYYATVTEKGVTEICEEDLTHLL